MSLSRRKASIRELDVLDSYQSRMNERLNVCVDIPAQRGIRWTCSIMQRSFRDTQRTMLYQDNAAKNDGIIMARKHRSVAAVTHLGLVFELSPLR